MARTRARTKKGAFIADDPNTPENEAWVRTSPKKDSKYSYGIKFLTKKFDVATNLGDG